MKDIKNANTCIVFVTHIKKMFFLCVLLILVTTGLFAQSTPQYKKLTLCNIDKCYITNTSSITLVDSGVVTVLKHHSFTIADTNTVPRVKRLVKPNKKSNNPSVEVKKVQKKFLTVMYRKNNPYNSRFFYDNNYKCLATGSSTTVRMCKKNKAIRGVFALPYYKTFHTKLYKKEISKGQAMYYKPIACFFNTYYKISRIRPPNGIRLIV